MKLLVAVLLAVSLSAQVTSNKPILRIETGMHSAMIRRASVDAREVFLATASEDKTVRIWDLASGRLLNILRPPIGDGNEGKLFAVAISPDGATVATGGFTSPAGWQESIYLFDRATGRVLRRIPGLPYTVQQLAFSPDGRFLAANLGGKNGIRIYRTADYALAGQDTAYGDDSYGSDFAVDSAGGLWFATSSYDGFVRLYSLSPLGALTLQGKIAPLFGKQPFSVSFAPNASRLAVTFNENSSVRVLSVPALREVTAPDTTTLTGGLFAAAWSREGDLLAGGQTHNPKVIVRWAQAGRGPRTMTPVSVNSIMQIIPLQRGRLLFASQDPSWGIIDAAGTKLLEAKSAIADYRNQASTDAVSGPADAVRLGYELWGKNPVLFSVAQRNLSNSPTSTGVSPPVTTGLNVTSWENQYEPKLDGRPLTIDGLEMARSLAIAPDRQRFVLGTEWSVRCYDRTGAQLWKIAAPGTAWSVNISGSGKVALAWLGDGTIRWYRMSDAKELLAFFPHADRKRWVLWTPAGYYDASPGAEDLIGWHVNNGRDTAADFFPASRFRSIYYRPDVVSRVLATLDESEALRLADSELNQRRRDVDIARVTPPIVRILSPNEGTTVSTPEVTLRYQARSTSGEPITSLRVLVDGRPVETPRAFSPVVGDTRELHVTIPKKDCEISLIAENRFAASEPAMLRLKWQGVQEQFSIKPKLYVLSIGINYADPYRLAYPAKDAQDFANTVNRQKGLLYREVNARVLTNAKATRDEILDGLDWIEKNTTQHDVAMVYLAGHGVNDTNGIYYYLPIGFDPERLKRTAIAFSDIRNTVQSMAGKVVFFVDTCHSGNVLGARTRSMASDINAFINELSSAENGAVVFAASTGRQLALERDEWGNGAFTKALLEGLSGKADYQSTGKITVNMLDLYVSERVKQLTGGRQTPATTKPKTISDFPVAVRQ